MLSIRFVVCGRVFVVLTTVLALWLVTGMVPRQRYLQDLYAMVLLVLRNRIRLGWTVLSIDWTNEVLLLTNSVMSVTKGGSVLMTVWVVLTAIWCGSCGAKMSLTVLVLKVVVVSVLLICATL